MHLGVWVHFNEGLLQDYGIVLKYFYEHSLNWAYEPDDNPLPKRDIEHVIEENKSIDMESFLGYFFLWKYVSTRLHLPIPPLERIVPFVVS